MYLPDVMTSGKASNFAHEFKVLCEQIGETDLRLAVTLETTPVQIWRWRTGAQTPDATKQSLLLERLRRMAGDARKRKPKA